MKQNKTINILILLGFTYYLDNIIIHKKLHIKAYIYNTYVSYYDLDKNFNSKNNNTLKPKKFISLVIKRLRK